MKKQITKVLLVIASLSLASFAYAAEDITSTGTSLGTQTFKPSNNVTLKVSSVAGDPTDPGGYSVTSYHASGDREFATNSAEPKIFWQTKPDSATTPTCTDSTTFTPDISSWTSL